MAGGEAVAALAQELTASARDGSTPLLALDRLWLRSDQRLVLLDFPPVSAAVPSPASAGEERSHLTPVGLVSRLATHGLSMGAPTREQTLMPLSAHALLMDLASAVPPSLDRAQARLIEVAATRDLVRRWQRAIPIALASVPTTFILAFALLVALPTMYRFFSPPTTEMLALLETLYRPNPRTIDRVSRPDIRAAIERYLAGRHGATLTDSSFWNSPIMRGVSRRLQPTARDVASRHRSVSVDQLARAEASIAPELARARRRPTGRGGLSEVAAPIIGVLTALTLVLVTGASLLSSILAPGGLVTRLLGLAVVTRQGSEIGRWQSLGRTVIAWLPAIVWLAWLAASPKIQGFVPTRGASLPVLGLVLAGLVAGAIWTLARPTRGPHDWLARTWVVPR